MACKRPPSSGSRKGSADGVKPNLDIFMILGNILVDKDDALYRSHIGNELFASAFSPYMVLRYLSMNQNASVRNVVMEHLTTLEGMADRPEMMYRLLMKIVPKTYNRFTPYIKSGFRPRGSAKGDLTLEDNAHSTKGERKR